MIRLLTPEEIEEISKSAHKAGREFYDTPSSVKGCPCSSCNKSRERHGVPVLTPEIEEIYYVTTNNLDNKYMGFEEGKEFDSRADALKYADDFEDIDVQVIRKNNY